MIAKILFLIIAVLLARFVWRIIRQVWLSGSKKSSSGNTGSNRNQHARTNTSHTERNKHFKETEGKYVDYEDVSE